MTTTRRQRKEGLRTAASAAARTPPLLLLLVLPVLLASSTLLLVVAAAGDAEGGDGEGEKKGPMPDDFNFNGMGGQNCQSFRCTSGREPVPKSRLSFSSTGCSAMGGNMIMMGGGGGDTEKKQYEECCDRWHACYQICGSSKKMCDENFKKCSETKCGGDEECNKSANLNSMLTSLSGCSKYDESQLKACECADKDKAEKAREKILARFYEKYADEPSSSDKVRELMKKADTKLKFATLLNRLVEKYPNSIKHVEDPQAAMYAKMMEDAAEAAKEADGEDGDGEKEEDEESASEEHIEL